MLKLHQTLEQAFPQEFLQVNKYESKTEHIQITEADVTFTFQEGAAKEHSTPGILVEDLIKFATSYIKIMDSDKGCPENKEAIKALEEALYHLDQRTLDRIKRNVEGTSND